MWATFFSKGYLANSASTDTQHIPAGHDESQTDRRLRREYKIIGNHCITRQSRYSAESKQGYYMDTAATAERSWYQCDFYGGDRSGNECVRTGGSSYPS